MRLLPVKIVIVLALLTLCGFRFSLLWGALSWEKIDAVLSEDFPDVKMMEIEELARRLTGGEKNLYLVDVRSREEYLVSHIPGAIWVEEFDPGNIPVNGVIVAYCSVGLRSAEFVREQQKAGIQGIYNLRGSIFMWANKGLELASAVGRGTEVHPYNSRWGRLLDKRLHSRQPDILGQHPGS